jgi:DNA-directed RNA polymerase beta subunit
VETPEGTNIGLRKNLALLASISLDSNEEEIFKSLRAAGLKEIPREAKDSKQNN